MLAESCWGFEDFTAATRFLLRETSASFRIAMARL